MKLIILTDLFLTFMKIGGFTIGGGYAMIPVIQEEIADKKKWVSEQEMADFITISQSVPGVISINCATAVGRKVAGLPGAIAATAGVITPSLVVILVIAYFFDAFLKFDYIQRAFNGVRGAVAALIFAAVIRLGKTSIGNIFQGIIFAVTAVCIILFKISPQYMLLLAALTSVLYGRFYVKKTDGDKP